MQFGFVKAKSKPIPVAASRAIAATDAGCVLDCTSSSEIQLTINGGVMGAGDSVVIARAGAGAVRFIFGAGVTPEYDSERFNAAIANRYDGATLYFKSSSRVWLTGSLEAVATTPPPASDATPAWLFSLIGDY